MGVATAERDLKLLQDVLAANLYVPADDRSCARDDSPALGREHRLSRQISESEIYPTVQRVLSQPFLVVEIFTGTPDNSWVWVATTVSGFDEVLSGNCDDIPGTASYI